MDFAFFAVNFGYSRDDYDSLTMTERAFIYKAWEDRIVLETTFLRDTVFNAVSNAFRKKNKKFRKLWHKKQKKADKELMKDNIQIAKDVEAAEGKDWVRRIYETNGLKIPGKRKGKEAPSNG